MSNQWLWQIFKKEGKILDVYVSKKCRLNKSSLFGFVRLDNESDAISAIRKNNGLVVKGFKMTLSMSRYEKPKVQLQVIPQKQPQQGKIKVWRPALRDTRSYREATLNCKEVQGVIKQDEWLKMAFICSEDEKMEAQEATQKIQDTGIQNLIVSKLDDFSIIVNKKVMEHETPLIEDEETKL